MRPETLFETIQEGKKKRLTETVKPTFSDIAKGNGKTTIKYDGALCAVVEGKLYKKYTVKPGKVPPKDFIPIKTENGYTCGWLLCKMEKAEDKWYWEAVFNTPSVRPSKAYDGLYVAVGKHFNGNPYNVPYDTLKKYGNDEIVVVDRTFKGLKNFIKTKKDKYGWNIDGIIFWRDGEDVCKVDRKDFGLDW